MAAGGAQKEMERRRRPGLRIEVTGAGGILVLGGAVIAAGLGAAWAAHRARAKNRSKQADAGERGRRDEGEERSRSGLRSLLLPHETPSAPSLSCTEIGELSHEVVCSHEELSVEAKRMGTQENGFISEIKKNSEICMTTEESHLEASIHGDDMKHSLLNGDESNMPEYSKEPIAEGLMSFDVKEAVEESEGAEEIEETPPVESKEEGTESSIEEEGEKGEEGSDETSASSVELTIEAKRMGTQENGFICEIKQNSDICMATKENHLEASIHGDDTKHFSLDGDKSNMPEYSKEPIADRLMSIDVKEAVEESEGGEEIEEAPSVESDEEGTESSIEVEGEKGEEGSDETAASSVESNTEAIWPAETFEMEESLPPLESIQMKNNLEIIEETKDIVNAARSTEEEIVEEYEEKGLILDEGEAIAAGNMKTTRLPTTMSMEKEMDITPISYSKVSLLLLVLALSIGLLSFMHHHHLYALYQQFCQFFFVVNNDDL